MSNDVNTFLLCGPYMGDFKQEILTFKPYVDWLTEVIPHKKAFVKTHFNREFMYNDKITSAIDKTLSLNELDQKNYYNKNIVKKDFNTLLKNFKTDIINTHNITKKQCKAHSLSYVQFLQPYSIYQKFFKPIETPYDIEIDHIGECIIFIPDESETEEVNEIILKALSEQYNVLVIGDTKTNLHSENIILKKPDYSENVYKYIIKYLSMAKCVVTPSSHWTYLCNLQQVPVFSWGNRISLYKAKGDLNFGNFNSLMFKDDDTDIKKVINQIHWFINKL